MTDLFSYIKKWDLDSVKKLINQDNLNLSSRDWFTPLVSSIIEGQLEITEYLLNNGADVDQVIDKNTTPLMLVSMLWLLGSTELLLSFWANLDYKDNDWWTALMFAVSKKQKSIIKLLLEYGANPNLKNKEKRWALIYAIPTNDIEIINLLLEYGAKTRTPDKFWQTPISIAYHLIAYGDISKEVFDLISWYDAWWLWRCWNKLNWVYKEWTKRGATTPMNY